jgi:hypothetical protein
VGARRKASDQQVNASDERLQAEYASMKLNLAALWSVPDSSRFC